MAALAERYPAETEAVPAARQALNRFRGRVPRAALEDARLMVSELVTNSLRHGGLSQDSSIELLADIEGSTLRVQVRDRGRGFSPRPRTIDSATDSGWGLYLVDQLADRWGTVDVGMTCVWFELDLEASPSERDSTRPKEA